MNDSNKYDEESYHFASLIVDKLKTLKYQPIPLIFGQPDITFLLAHTTAACQSLNRNDASYQFSCYQDFDYLNDKRILKISAASSFTYKVYWYSLYFNYNSLELSFLECKNK